jgi:hypothetical protein
MGADYYIINTVTLYLKKGYVYKRDGDSYYGRNTRGQVIQEEIIDELVPEVLIKVSTETKKTEEIDKNETYIRESIKKKYTKNYLNSNKKLTITRETVNEKKIKDEKVIYDETFEYNKNDKEEYENNVVIYSQTDRGYYGDCDSDNETFEGYAKKLLNSYNKYTVLYENDKWNIKNEKKYIEFAKDYNIDMKYVDKIKREQYSQER